MSRSRRYSTSCIHAVVRHPTGAATRAKASFFTRKGNDLLMVAIAALQPQKPVGEDAAIEEGVEFCFDVIGQTVCGFRLNLGEERLGLSIEMSALNSNDKSEGNTIGANE